RRRLVRFICNNFGLMVHTLNPGAFVRSWPGSFGGLRPVITQSFAKSSEVMKGVWLDDESAGAEPLSFEAIPDEVGRAKGGDFNGLEFVALLDPMKDLETVHARHFKVEKQQAGKRLVCQCGMGQVRIEIRDGFFAAAYDMDRVWYFGGLESVVNQEDVL